MGLKGIDTAFVVGRRMGSSVHGVFHFIAKHQSWHVWIDSEHNSQGIPLFFSFSFIHPSFFFPFQIWYPSLITFFP